MKVGILSMQKVKNYGSFLQGFALKKTIEDLGHQCEFIDIEQGVIFPELKRNISFLLKKVVERYCKGNVITRLKYAKKFQKRFSDEFFDLLGVNVHTMDHFDIAVIGSDEVFNFAQRVAWGYTTQLYGNIKNADKVISYAGSFGHTTMKDINHFGVREEIARTMKSMSAISVRDNNSVKIVEELTGVTPYMHIDPVLMFDYLPYVKENNCKDYMLIYTYPNRINDVNEIKAIKSFAKKHGKKLISIGFYFPWCDETVIPDPFEVLGYIKGADYIITDTFHGSVMSLKFNRRFAALVRPSNMQKMTSLLSQFSLQGRIVDDIHTLDATLLSNIDYDYVNLKLQEERDKSLEYLQQNIR
ncbi:MAG: polysaccharide pyruvyl transferase family protein [Rikenellaceae bacterium]|nr:polysaccharide pyruvyl transferase family protein [Rikenellaceae bacterium]